MNASFHRVTAWFAAACLFLCVGTGFSAETTGAKPQVLYLHTEFFPYKKTVANDLPYRMSREMIRQALLVAAREEMGLSTCDETLQEAPPADAEVVHLILTERSNLNGKWNVKISRFVEGAEVDASEPIWEKTYKYRASGTSMYADMVPKLEADIHGEFVEALKKAGLRSTKVVQQNAASPPEEIEKLLLKPDFITQFGAVRAAHQAIASGGESPEWTSVLVRGYGNMALLTHHQWTAMSEAFAARSWHYAQRMVAADPQNAFAMWNRAYAWTLSGVFQHAISDFKAIKKLSASAEATPASGDPPWRELIMVYARSKRPETKQIGETNAALKPWATCLWFQLTNYTRYPSWMFEAGQEVAHKCPTFYGAFSEMAHHGQQLAVIRTAASLGPRAFARFAPESLDAVPGMPQEIRDVLPTDDAKRAALDGVVHDPNPSDYFSALPSYVASKLRERSRQTAEGDLSWSALASLLEEEQFVEIAHFLDVSTNATESSLDAEVDSVLPLVKGHRYAPYVESFYYNHRRDLQEMRRVGAQMSIRDSRNNMSDMFTRFMVVPNATGELIGKTGRDHAQRNFTVPGIIEGFFVHGSDWRRNDPRLDGIFANELAAIAPGSEVGTRMQIQAARKPKPEQLKAWEEKLREDPTGFSTLAEHYRKLDDTESAIRCYEKSLAALPTTQATIGLAAIYRDQNDRDKWEQTLLKFLETEDLGLQHATIHQQLAHGFARQGQWGKAKPHALAAAETYSGSGLSVASYICEGLGEWEESEKWAQEMATSYPSYSGDVWYFWCRRTGRGDLQKAGAMAKDYFSVRKPNPAISDHMRRGAYLVLDGDFAAARDSYQEALKLNPSFTCTFMVAQLSRELKDEPRRAEVIAAMENAVANPKPDADPRIPEVDAAGLLVLDLMKNGNPTDERLTKLDAAMAKLGKDFPNTRSAMAYYTGAELDALGQVQEAEKYWRRSLIEPSYDPDLATLAGAKLVKLRGTSRPDDDVLDESDLWPSLEPKQ